PFTGLANSVDIVAALSQVFNFSTTSDTVLVNGEQIHPERTPPPEILAHQVTQYSLLYDVNDDLSYSNLHPNVPFYPLSRVGYVVNVSSRTHPPGSGDSSLVTVNFRTIQVGSKVLDCLDTVELFLLQATRGGPLVVK